MEEIKDWGSKQQDKPNYQWVLDIINNALNTKDFWGKIEITIQNSEVAFANVGRTHKPSK